MKGLSGIFVALGLVISVAGCSGGGGGGGCFMANQACSFATQCCGGLTCTNKVCVADNQCNAVGTACSPGACCQGLTCMNNVCTQGQQCASAGQACINGACCQNQNLTCTNNTCTMVAQCAGTNESCATATCCQGLSCDPNSKVCTGVDTRKNFGQGPCSAQGDCKTNVCITFPNFQTEGECSAACNSSTQCAALSQNPIYWCVAGQNAGFCLRQCSNSAACSDIGADWTCDVSIDTENLMHGLCGIFKNLAEGQPCTQDNQCAGGACNGSWCAATQPGCGNDAACGSIAVCIKNINNAQSCFPKCTTNADCAQYGVLTGLNYTCKPTTSVDGTSVMVCSG